MCNSCLPGPRPEHRFKIGEKVRVYDQVDDDYSWDEAGEVTGLLWNPPEAASDGWVYQITYQTVKGHSWLPMPYTELTEEDTLYPIVPSGTQASPGEEIKHERI
jgi:hypothetical protein